MSHREEVEEEPKGRSNWADHRKGVDMELKVCYGTVCLDF